MLPCRPVIPARPTRPEGIPSAGERSASGLPRSSVSNAAAAAAAACGEEAADPVMPLGSCARFRVCSWSHRSTIDDRGTSRIVRRLTAKQGTHRQIFRPCTPAVAAHLGVHRTVGSRVAWALVGIAEAVDRRRPRRPIRRLADDRHDPPGDLGNRASPRRAVDAQAHRADAQRWRGQRGRVGSAASPAPKQSPRCSLIFALLAGADYRQHAFRPPHATTSSGSCTSLCCVPSSGHPCRRRGFAAVLAHHCCWQLACRVGVVAGLVAVRSRLLLPSTACPSAGSGGTVRRRRPRSRRALGNGDGGAGQSGVGRACAGRHGGRRLHRARRRPCGRGRCAVDDHGAVGADEASAARDRAARAVVHHRAQPSRRRPSCVSPVWLTSYAAAEDVAITGVEEHDALTGCDSTLRRAPPDDIAL